MEKVLVNEVEAKALEGFLSEGQHKRMPVIAPPFQKVQVEKPKVVPNRKMLRRKKINLSRAANNQYARPIRRGPQPPASLYALVAVHVRDESGRTLRKFVIPKEQFERRNNVQPSTQQPLPENG